MASAGDIRAGRAFVEFGTQDAGLERGLRNAQAKFAATAKAIQRVGTGVAIAGAAIGYPMVVATQSAAKFQDAILELTAATAEITPRQLRMVRDEALRLSSALGVAPEEIGAAFAQLIKAGMSVEQAMGGAVKSAVEFSRISGVSIQTAATLMKVSMDVFGTSAAEAVDTLSAAADSSATDITQIVEGFSQIGAAGRTFNQSLFSIAQGMAVLSGAYIMGEEAGTALKVFLLRLVAPSKQAEEQLRKFGLTLDSFRDSKGNLLELAELAGVFQDALKDLPQEQWQRALTDFFGDRGVKVVTTFVNTGRRGFQDIAKAMEESRSVSAKFRVMMSGLSGSMTRIASAAARVGVAFGESLTTPLWAASHALSVMSRAVSGFLTYFPVIGPLAASAALAMVALGASMVVVGAAWSGVLFGVGQLASLVLLASNAGAATAALALAARGLASALWAVAAASLAAYRGGLLAMASAGVAAALPLLRDGLLGLAVAMRTAFGVSVGRAVLTIGVGVARMLASIKGMATAVAGIKFLPVFGGLTPVIEGAIDSLLAMADGMQGVTVAMRAMLASFVVAPLRALWLALVDVASAFRYEGVWMGLITLVGNLAWGIDMAVRAAISPVRHLGSLFLWFAAVARTTFGVGVGRAILKIGAAAAITARAVLALGAAFMALPGAGWVAGIVAGVAAIGAAAWRMSSGGDDSAAKAKAKRPDSATGGSRNRTWSEWLLGAGGGQTVLGAGSGTFSGAAASQLGIGPGLNELQRISEFTERTAVATEKGSGQQGWIDWALGRVPGEKIEGTTLVSPAGPLSSALSPSSIRSGMVAEMSPRIVSAGPGLGDRGLLSAAERTALASESAAERIAALHRLIERRPIGVYT